MSESAVLSKRASAYSAPEPLRLPSLPRELIAPLPAPQERTLNAMIAVTALHIAAFTALMFPGERTLPMQPVLAFSVTLNELSSAPSTVSSAASAASTPAAEQQPEKKVVEQPKPEAKSRVVKKPAAAPKAPPAPKTDTQLSHNSVQQTAVIAPVTPASYNAAYLQNPAPSYPPLSRRMGEQGRVMLSVYVTEDGRAQTVKLKDSSGYSRLDNAAIESVGRWRFAPAKQGEKLMASWVQVPINFKLE